MQPSFQLRLNFFKLNVVDHVFNAILKKQTIVILLPGTFKMRNDLRSHVHEFLPDRTVLLVEVALGKERNQDVSRQEILLSAVDRLHESNPMLGLRGVRLGLVVPGLFPMQVRAIAQAAITRMRAGGNPIVEIMIPLVGSVMELHLIRDEMDVLLAVWAFSTWGSDRVGQ